jgi:hypothetical protein
MKNPKDELVWQGRTHLGDEPGVYGDAAYAGLATEFPMTVTPFDSSSPNEDITVVLEAEDVTVFSGYTGHVVTVTGYLADTSSGTYKWKEVPLTAGALNKDDLKLKVPSLQGCRYISVRVRVDTTVMAGLYDDFVVVRLSLSSTTHYADFGFRA